MRPVFVLIKCQLGKTYEVADAIVDDIDKTAEIYSISGNYDLLVRFNLGEDDDIGRFVCDTVQTVPNIRDTSTLIGFRLFTGPDRLGG